MPELTEVPDVGNLIHPSLGSVSHILRVAKDAQNPRVAYLCRWYALERTALNTGHCFFARRQLLGKKKEDNDTNLADTVNESDAAEMSAFFLQYYEHFIRSVPPVGERVDSAQLCAAYQTGKVLYEVLCAVNQTAGNNLQQINPEIIAAANDLQEKCKIIVPFNILPLDPAGASQPIMQLEEIKAAVSAFRNTHGLKWPVSFEQHQERAGDLDLLDWLRAMFGFQRDSVRNQREHLLLLLANSHISLHPQPVPLNKLDDRAVDAVMSDLFGNYKEWCKFLGQQHSLRLPQGQQEIQQRKLLYMGLYLLIWGEAANIRFLPECICYIFHNMANELDIILAGSACHSSYGGDNEAFLRKVITPIYQVIKQEAEKSRNGRAPHLAWRNYDDLNEYFWSPHCFRLGLPMHDDDDFFKSTFNARQGRRFVKTAGNTGKSNFVETRTIFQIFRSFYRLWAFYSLALQVMLIMAWNETSILKFFREENLWNLSSICITAAIIHFLHNICNLCLNFPIYHRWRFMDVLRDILKVVVSLFWVIALPLFYVHSFRGAPEFIKEVLSFIHQIKGIPPLYLPAVAVYLLPNLLAAALFLFPMLRRWIENSDWHIVRLLMWWSEPTIYVGRGMHESLFSRLKYTLFWVILLGAKFSFSFFIQIIPLVEPTKEIMSIRHVDYAWHGVFPRGQHNSGAVFAIWVPTFLIYFLDTQIWYSIISSLCGGWIGLIDHLGEIQSMRVLRARFQSLPGAFNKCLLPTSQIARTSEVEAANFSRLWNEIILTFREEDIITDRERDLLLVCYSPNPLNLIIQWPPCLLASKIPVALDMTANFDGICSSDLWKRMCEDQYMILAVIEGYGCFKHILNALVVGEAENRIIQAIIREVSTSISENRLLTSFRMQYLPSLFKRFVELVEILKDSDTAEQDMVIDILDKMLEVLTGQMMVTQIRELEIPEISFEGFSAVNFTFLTAQWKKQIQRLYLLLTVKESAIEVPTNLEARRRLAFFTNSLFMDMPRAPQVRKMLSFSVLTPYYSEETVYSNNDLKIKNEDKISILDYLQKIYPDEWNNFMERFDCKNEKEIWERDKQLHLRHWASLRGQTLCRTVRGMMYYRRALKLQAFLDMANEQGILDGYEALPVASHASLEAVVDTKFTYVISCQNYGNQKRSGDRRATDILNLMVNNTSLRVAYIDDNEESEGGRVQKVYYSVLVKAVGNYDVEIYRIKLPGPAKLGEGKPENQNHAVIFTRGKALQTIDMNQDNYLEEALKVRNLLEEFNGDHGVHRPSILGLREHIFTASVSSLAWFMSNQETSFVTINQRVLARLLKVRFHYGHPDIFDKLFHITRGGISKASRVINLSEDIFAGFNSTLRCGNVTHHEYIQVGKGRDVGFNQISLFEAKVACGNGEQTISRDIYRLGHRFDFFRMLSFYFTTIGFYISSLVVVLTFYADIYGKLYLSLSGFEAAVLENENLVATLTRAPVVQIGLLTVFPMMVEVILERGWQAGIVDLVLMLFQFAPVFFTFSLGTKAHYFGRTLLHGGAKYRATGRGFVVHHEKFDENYRLYSRSHFTKGIEMLILLICYMIYGSSDSTAYALLTGWLWFVALCWILAPFLFNPSGLEFSKVLTDWEIWKRWMRTPGGDGVEPNKSWESWWDEEQEYLHNTGFLGRSFEIFLNLRFFCYHFGIVYQLDVVKADKSIMVYAFSWLVIVLVLGILKILSIRWEDYRTCTQLRFRIGKLILLITALFLIGLSGLTLADLVVCLLAFLAVAWAVVQIAQATRPLVNCVGLWPSVMGLARLLEYLMGFLIFCLIYICSYVPFISVWQNRLLFNQVSQNLAIQGVFYGGKNNEQD